MENITLLFASGEIEKILKEAGMGAFVPGAIRLEDVEKLVEVAAKLDMITDTDSEMGVTISTIGDYSVWVRFGNGVRIMSDPIGDHFLKDVINVSNVVTANRLLSWAVGQAAGITEKFKATYTAR